MMLQNTSFELRFRVYVRDEPYLGPGRVELLENIDRCGSIARGAEAMKMSYRKAWQLVEDMNRLAGQPLVKKRLGGSKGGGAEVTEAGREAIRKFRELKDSLEGFMEQRGREIF